MKQFLFSLSVLLSLSVTTTTAAVGLTDEGRKSIETTMRDLSKAFLSFPKEEEESRHHYHRALLLSKQSEMTGHLLAKDLVTKLQVDEKQRRQRRRLADHDCVDLEAVVAGNCTLQEFCDFVETQETNGLLLTCQGEPTATWTATAVFDQEQCLYLSSGNLEDAAPYNADKFDEKVDFCLQIQFVLEYSAFFPVRQEETVEFTRGASGVFTQEYQVTACDASDLDEFLLNGYCTECSAASLDGLSCNSCAECPDGSNRETSVDCANLSPDFLLGCDSTENDEFIPFALYSGALCTYYGAVNEACSLDRFCGIVEISISQDEDRSVSCTTSGSVQGSWDFNLDFDEYCYYGKTRTEGPFDDQVFDHVNNGDYCWIERVEYESIKGSPVSVLYSRTFTRPLQGVGTFSVRFPLTTDCGDDSEFDEDDIFFPNVCEKQDVCPEVTIAGILCTSDCVSCADGLEPTCTNVHPDLVPDCMEEEAVSYTVLNYFSASSATDGSTNPSTPTTSAPSPSSASMKAVAVPCVIAALLGFVVARLA